MISDNSGVRLCEVLQKVGMDYYSAIELEEKCNSVLKYSKEGCYQYGELVPLFTDQESARSENSRFDAIEEQVREDNGKLAKKLRRLINKEKVLFANANDKIEIESELSNFEKSDE